MFIVPTAIAALSPQPDFLTETGLAGHQATEE
jgi:hypothetical protein